jgi:hypothetical protein
MRFVVDGTTFAELARGVADASEALTRACRAGGVEGDAKGLVAALVDVWLGLDAIRSRLQAVVEAHPKAPAPEIH